MQFTASQLVNIQVQGFVFLLLSEFGHYFSAKWDPLIYSYAPCFLYFVGVLFKRDIMPYSAGEPLPSDRHSLGFHFFASLNHATVNILYACSYALLLFLLLGWIPRRGVCGSKDINIFNCNRYCQIAFKNGCNILHFHTTSNSFLNRKLSLWFQDKPSLVILDDSFNVLLNLVCQNFIQDATYIFISDLCLQFLPFWFYFNIKVSASFIK